MASTRDRVTLGSSVLLDGEETLPSLTIHRGLRVLAARDRCETRCQERSKCL